jgi:hypothetical protein
VRTLQADLAAASPPDPPHLALAEALQQEAAELHGLWDLRHHRVVEERARVEAGLQQLRAVEAELGGLRAELGRGWRLCGRAGHGEASEDSGWASEDQEERIGRIRAMAHSLQAVLSPRAQSARAVARGLEVASSELVELQRALSSLRGGRGRGRGARRPGPARRRRLAKCCLGVNMMLLLVLFLSWLCQPSCCDAFSAMSAFSPQLKYVNGPPPI